MVGLWSVIAQITRSQSGQNDPSLSQYWSKRQTTTTGKCPRTIHPKQEQYYMLAGI
jgi:hypothetical protein